MSLPTIYPVILCGGSGSRLWPLSRASNPKQFFSLNGEATLFQKTVLRFEGVQGYAAPTIVSSNRFRFRVLDELEGVNVAARSVILEPTARDTAAAVLAAVLDIKSADPEGVALVLPSDHDVKHVDALIEAFGVAVKSDDDIMTFGIQPDRPETGYGYLEVNKDYKLGEITKVQRFVEKPNLERAQEMLAQGGYLWNSGIFMANVDVWVEAFEAHAPEILAAVTQSMQDSDQDMGFLRPNEAAWNGSPALSIDYAVMEKADNVSTVPINPGWSDLGDWQAIWRNAEKDADGVAKLGDVQSIDSKNTLLQAIDDQQVLVGIGLEDVFAVAMKDAVIVGHMDRIQDVKEAVERLKADGHKQAQDFPVDHRPWGWFESLALGERFQVKRIVVKPGASLSLQSHYHRSEHWIIVAGSAYVTIDDEVKFLSENQSVYVPLGAVHRLQNPGKIPLVMIEVQTGAYLGEEDIVRYEDDFGRK